MRNMSERYRRAAERRRSRIAERRYTLYFFPAREPPPMQIIRPQESRKPSVEAPCAG